MKTLTALVCGAILALVTTSQQCSAAFSFTLVPVGSTSVFPGGSLTINVFAADSAGATAFTIGSVQQIDVLNPFNNGISFTSFSPASGFTLGAPTLLGSFTANVSPLANYGHREVALNFVNINGILGASLGPQGNFLTNSVFITAVPEPTSLALVGLVATGLMFKRRRR